MPPARSAHPETIREEAANVLLAQLLRDHGLEARAERRSRRGAPDISVRLRTGDPVILECKWDGARRLLTDQLDDRLNHFPEALGVVGVLYPGELRQVENTRAGLQAAQLQWWLHGSRGAARSQPTLRRGSVAELADQLRALPLELEGVDIVVAAAGVVGHALEQAAGRVAGHARLARRIADIIARTDRETDRAAALRIGCLVLFNALAFQDRLAPANEDVPTVQEALRPGIPGLRSAWRYICDDIDYVPVFELALDILDVLIDGPDETQMPVIEPLLAAVRRTRRVEGHDLSGRLFHTLLTDAKFTGAYYTSVPAATLLTRLVFHDWPPQVDWRDHEFPGSLNVADLACGTGTLLMAVAAEAERRHRRAGGRDAAALHKAMVEQALHGYDVQLSAIHFAATSLAMLNPDIQFDRMNLYVMPLGAEGETVALGSLDFLGAEAVPVQFALSPQQTGVAVLDPARVSGRGPRGAKEGETATLPNLDLAIMNPPFTRSVGGNLLFGSLPAGDRRKLQTELSRRLKSRQASATAGLGAAFVAAASPRLRPGEGRLALVLPATVCTGPSWRQTRALIERDFALDTVVTSHDPQRWNFSDSTDLSESLLIATRRPRPAPAHSEPDRPTSCLAPRERPAASAAPGEGSSGRHPPAHPDAAPASPPGTQSSPPSVIPGSSPGIQSPASPPSSLTPNSSSLSPSPPRTTFVNLWHNPAGVLDAHRLARAVAAATPARLEDTGTALLEIDGRHVGEVVSLPESKLAGKQWAGVQFARADLLRSALRLLDDGQVWVPGEPDPAPVPLCRLDQLGQIGPDRRRLVDGFARTKSVTAYPLVEGHDTEQRTSLTCAPDSYLSPLSEPKGGQRPGYGQHLWQQASRLLVAERLWLETTRIAAMRSEVNVLSNVWWPVRVADETTEKALTVWLNSSLGLLTILAQRTSTRGGWVALKKADLAKLPVLDIPSLPPPQRQALAHLFDQLTDAQFQRLPALPHDPARRQLDESLAQILNLPPLTTLRRLLATEPTISNHRL